jgi:hypothetical protein
MDSRASTFPPVKILLICGLLACLTTGVRAEISQKAATEDLILQFKQSASFWLQAKVAEKIIELHDPSVLPELAGYLTIEDRHARGNAALIYARLGDDRGFQIIKHMLTDDANRPSVEGLINGSGQYSPQLRSEAINTMPSACSVSPVILGRFRSWSHSSMIQR